jgi:hypothetical protein
LLCFFRGTNSFLVFNRSATLHRRML